MKGIYVEVNLKTAKDKFAEVDWHKLQDGRFLSADELNECVGVCASCGILINDKVTEDYRVVLEDGSVEIGSW